jgi:DNA-binding NarL/FixJ family response regulator
MMPNETILVVDADKELVQHLKEGLSKAGYRVLTVADVSTIGQTVRDERPDAIILDYRLPSPGGLELCKQVKGDSATRHIPVIFISEKPKPDEMVAAFETGAQDIVAKPLNDDEFYARLGAAISNKLAHDRMRQKISKLEALAKHVRAAMQHYEQPGAMESKVEFEKDDADGEAIVRLTRRENEILQLLARGLSNEVISKQLYISPTTTRNHIQNILGKLGVHSKLEAVAYAVRAGYVDFVG